jgi:hypothetical protein
MDIESKAKLANKLTHALHQAPNHPEAFVNIVRQVTGTAGLHITDLAITFGDLTARMHERLQAARRDAQPTYDNLRDLAETKICLGRKPERVLAKVIGVQTNVIEDCKRHGRVPRTWFEKIGAMPDRDEARAHFDAETVRVIRIISEAGYTPEDIDGIFQRIRTSRGGLKQIATIVHGQNDLSAELTRMQRELFGEAREDDIRFRVWLSTHLRTRFDELSEPIHSLGAKQVERLRARFRREIRLRESDAAYLRVASAAELIERPLKANSRGGGDPVEDSRLLRSRLDRLFGGETEERHNIWLAQLTGLDERHTLDLLKGANGVAQIWWKFLDAVEAAVTLSEEAPLLRSMFAGQTARAVYEL